MRTIAPLVLDHAQARSARRRPAAALALLALAVAALAALRCSELGAEARALEQEAARMSRPAARQAVQARPEADRPDPVRRALGVPWEQAWRALEQAGGADVSLLTLDAAPEQQRVRLSGEARSLQALLGYLRRLGASRAFAAVELHSHQVVQDDPQRPVRFVVVLAWRGAP